MERNLPLDVVFDFGEDFFVEDGILACFFLFQIIVVETDNVLAKQEDGKEVDDGHECHAKIYQAPGLLQTHEATHEDGETGDDTESLNHPLTTGDETDVGLAVEVIGNDGAVAKRKMAAVRNQRPKLPR